MTMVNSRPDLMNLSFSGCGFLCIYHAGVAAAIKEYAPQLTVNKISGASAGAIIAAGLCCGVCISQATSTVLKVVGQARSRALGPLHPAFNLLAVVREEVVRTLPPDAWRRCNDRLQISLTRWSDMKNVVVSKFDNNKDLIDAIICSCFIPVYCGVVPPTYKGVAYIDGGFTDNQPAIDAHTVTVSPFSGESDICPPDWDSNSLFGLDFSGTSIRFTTRNLFRLTACLMPPSTEDCSKMCLQGFEDALRFLTKNGMAPCIRCLKIQTESDDVPNGRLLHRPSDSPLSSSLVSPPPRSRNRSFNAIPSTSRMRVESECDTCVDSDLQYTTEDIFPTIMKRTLDDAAAAEESYFSYLLSFRVFRYARTALGLGKLPVDMLVIFTTNLTSWLSRVSAPLWLTDRLQKLVDLVVSEVEQQKDKYSARYSCQLAITEMDYEGNTGLHTYKEHEPMELSREAEREMALFRKRDKKRKRTSHPLTEDFDSLHRVIEYTHEHDALYEFHYLDENKKMRSFELFDMSRTRARGRGCAAHSGHTPSPTAARSHSARPVSMVLEEEADETDHQEPVACSSSSVRSPSPGKEEADSGLSESVDESRTSRRDACCSPMRLPQPTATIRAHRGRRHTQPASRKSSSVSSSAAKSAAAAAAAVSSDSEAELGDQLFVPSRRLRTCSREYEGEPEQSDS